MFKVMTKGNILFVINPISGIKRGLDYNKYIKFLNDNNYNVDTIFWQSANEDITEIVKNSLNNKNYEIVVVFGGDGTINKVGRALLFRKEKLCIIPVGSGNGLARYLGIPLNVDKAIKLCISGKVKAIDAVKVNNDYFFCTSGIGYDAYVAHLFAKSKRRGLFTYVKVVIKSFLKYKPDSYIVEFDEDKLQTKAFFITIANTNQWGGGVKVAPDANISDGILNVVIFLTFKWYNILWLAFLLLSGQLNKTRNVKEYKVNKVILRSNLQILEGHYDGEPVIFPSELKYECVNKALKVLVPNE